MLVCAADWRCFLLILPSPGMVGAGRGCYCRGLSANLAATKHGRPINNTALRAAGVPSSQVKWRDLAAYRGQWRVPCGAKARGAVPSPPKHPRNIRTQRSPMAHRPPIPPTQPATAPTFTRRQQPRIPAPTPELTATQKWRAAYWATSLSQEPGLRGITQPRPATPAPKPRLTSPSAFQQEIETRKNDTRAECTMHSAQPAAEHRWSNRRTNTHAARGFDF